MANICFKKRNEVRHFFQFIFEYYFNSFDSFVKPLFFLIIQPLQGCGAGGKAFWYGYLTPSGFWANLDFLSALEATTGRSTLGSRFSAIGSHSNPSGF